jgi:hypothetical protein
MFDSWDGLDTYTHSCTIQRTVPWTRGMIVVARLSPSTDGLNARLCEATFSTRECIGELTTK